ncbi:MAG: 4-hydroxybenzoate octaprenyltransferase [Chloroflexota bacterium]|nr:MAG: 4-hydroxybenzoate octaprenyltransferase [Chloroflexota bacterium]
MGKVLLVLDSIKFEHTIFALPFAYIGMVLAARGSVSWQQVLWITVAMAGARTLAMAANRLIDRHIDALNPRTAMRALPRGLLSAGDMILLGAVGAVALIFAAAQLNDLCVKLLPIAAVVLVGYNYTKRFTWLSHFVLGFADGMAPVGGWIAITGSVDLEAVLLGLAVTFWIGGFDLIYACQDVDFDRSEGLYSIPARFGIAAGLWLSIVCHALTVLLLVAVGISLGLGSFYWLGVAITAGLLIYEHTLVRPRDLSRLTIAFFNMNGYIAVTMFVFVMAAVYIR